MDSDGSRGSVTAFTYSAPASGEHGGGVLPFTKGIGAYVPPPATPDPGWAYTNYTYAENDAGPHAVTSLSNGDSFTYDANGNMTVRVEDGSTYTQVFNAENRLASVEVGGETTSFEYDGAGRLVKETRPDGTSTIYVAGIYEVELDAAQAITKETSYYAVPGARVMRVDDQTTQTVYYAS